MKAIFKYRKHPSIDAIKTLQQAKSLIEVVMAEIKKLTLKDPFISERPS